MYLPPFITPRENKSMSAPLSIVRPEDELGPAPRASISFPQWLFREAKRVRVALVVAIAGASAVFNFIIALEINQANWDERAWMISATQAFVILLLLAVLAFGPRPRYFDGKPRGSGALQQFWNWWPLLWVSWLILYVAWTFAGWAHYPLKQPLARVGFHFLNNLPTLMLLMCYHILATPTLPDELAAEGDILATSPEGEAPATKKHDENRRRLGTDMAKFTFWASLFLVATLLELAIALSPSRVAEPNPGLRVDEVLAVFGLVYGIAAATATALFVGQLDSTLLGVPRFAIVVLFVYASIQPLFDIILGAEAQELYALTLASALMIALALVGKVLLFAIIYWAALTDRMFYFLVQNYTLYTRVAEHRDDFLRKERPKAG
jgi:hypothetical protein